MSKTFFAFAVFCSAVAVSAAPRSPAPTQAAEHQQWVAQSPAEMHTVKVHVGFQPEGTQFDPAANPKDKIVSLSEPVIDDQSQPN